MFSENHFITTGQYRVTLRDTKKDTTLAAINKAVLLCIAMKHNNQNTMRLSPINSEV